jgi:hypothetical protein
VYSEYFKRGSEPHELCELHPERSFFDRIAGLFGASPDSPTPAGAAGVPGGPANGPSATPAAAPTGTTASTPPPSTGTSVRPEEEKKKKRGFWSRVFGLGRGEKKKPEEKKKPQ